MRAPRWIAAALAALALALAAAGPASAQAPLPPRGTIETPAGYELSARQAGRIANQVPDVFFVSEKEDRLRMVVQAKPPLKWEVTYYDPDDDAVVQVHVDGRTGEVLETWTGYQAAWGMARGYEGQFGHALNAPWVWIPLCALFFVVLFDWRRARRWAHLDLLVLLAFGASHYFFNLGEIGVSVPLAYPPLLYLLARMLWLGFRGAGGLNPRVPTIALLLLCLLLAAFRITLNVVDSGVIDVGYAGVIGAERITHGEDVWGDFAFPADNRRGDTYGPANYLFYVPFELIWSWSGEWDELRAAHGAAIFFDLLTVAGLFALGLRLRPGSREAGIRTGLILAFAWLAYPYTAFALQSNSNDALVAALLVWGLVAWTSPLGRGALVAVAGMVKFAPLALAPLYITGSRALRPAARAARGGGVGAALRRFLRGGQARAGLAFAVMTGALLALPLLSVGLETFWERTAASQLERESPFSIWGQVEGLEWLQKAVLAAGGLLALALAFVPRERGSARAAALAAAVMIALELAVDHWFYLYIPWFCGLVFAALVGDEEERRKTGSPAGGVASRPTLAGY
jgi:hypothetical protein